MATENFKAADVSPTVLRLHPDIKSELMRLAFINDRSLSKEISIRLRSSLESEGVLTAKSQAPKAITHTDPSRTAYSTERTTTPAIATDVEPAGYGVTDIERAMLAIFRAMPAEKQLSLLTLFR